MLQQLYLPDRYEGLRDHLGADLVRVLVGPPADMENAFLAVAQSIETTRRGVFVPAYGLSGTGKSTLANSLDHFYGDRFAPPVAHIGDIGDDRLEQTMGRAMAHLATNDDRAIPVVIDGREGEPASGPELAALKRFLRTDTGQRAGVLWLETSKERAGTMSRAFEDIAGESSVELPLEIRGPDRDMWPGIARTTLELSNQVANLESLGVDPTDYEPAAFNSLGGYLARIASDFNAQTREMLGELAKPTQIVVAFASESRDVGPIAQLTEGHRLGLLNAHALVGATPGTDMGRWWSERMGLLTSTIVRLNARSYVLPPTVTVTALRRAGEDEVRRLLEDHAVADVDPVPYWQRSDLGRFMLGEERDTPETRGNPSEPKIAAFRQLGAAGYFSSGRDRALNAAIARSLAGFLSAIGQDGEVTPEKQLETPRNHQGNIIPDILVEEPEIRTCIEITWRQGEWVTSSNRAAIAEYILRKLRGYASALGWVA